LPFDRFLLLSSSTVVLFCSWHWIDSPGGFFALLSFVHQSIIEALSVSSSGLESFWTEGLFLNLAT
jgi:hypothetical protein